MKLSVMNDQNDLEKNLDIVLKRLKKTILDDLEFKQGTLITYWVNDWNNIFLKNEKTFDPKKLIKYKKGNIIKANLGFNVGSEQGGLHYCLILDNKNQKSSNVVTVLPLRSLKDKEDIARININHEFYLGSALLTDKILECEKNIEDLTKEYEKLNEKLKILGDEKTSEHNTIINRIRKIKFKEKEFNKELVNLNKGSVVLLSQIRTISKLRISEPLKVHHSLSKFVLNSDKMDELEKLLVKKLLKSV